MAVERATHPTRPQPVPSRAEEQALARLDPQVFLTKAVETNANIETLERLIALAKDVRAWQAREAYYKAMADFQRQCPRIPKSKTADIRSARANYSYDWAPLDTITKVIDPVLSDCGLTKRWENKIIAGQQGPIVSVKCIITHELGHSEDSGELLIPVASQEEGRGAPQPQRVASSLTYGKRYTLIGILGLTPEDDEDHDDDGSGGGAEHHEDEPGPPASDHEQPRRPAPAEPTSPRAETAKEISAAVTRHQMTTEERLALGQKYLKGKALNRADESDLEQLAMFLGDSEAVAGWRKERAEAAR
jgi:hypothetical protein